MLWLVFRCFAGIDGKLEALPVWLKKVVGILSDITLEIYVVQVGIIPLFAKILPFPLNWLLITSVIVGGALVLHFICGKLVSGTVYLLQKIKK